MTKVRKPVRRRKSKQRTTAEQDRRKMLLWSVLIPLVMVTVGWVLLVNTDFGFTIKRWLYGEDTASAHTASEHEVRNMELMQKHSDYIYGIDISQYQGGISWIDVNTIYDEIPVDFVFIRATMGVDAKDKRFAVNWKAAQSRAKLRGAYHYFRPNENSIRQAHNFINMVDLRSGDLPPVLDIEERPQTQSMDSLKVGLKRWLDEVERYYGIQPILYSGDSYFTDFLEREFSEYVLWIANYNFWVDKPKKHWTFWQFSERGYVRGINGDVDLNMFKGTIEELEELTVPY